MDGQHDGHAVSHTSHNLDGLHNGIYSAQHESYFSDQSNNGFDPGWAFNQPDNFTSSATQPMPVYHDWQQHSVPTPDPYGRQYSKSPAAQQPSPYSNYPDPRQFQTSNVYDPALTGTTSTTNQHLYPASSIYQSQAALGATISPEALENAPQQTVQLPQRPYVSQPPVDQKALLSTIPPSQSSGLFSTINYDLLARSANTKRMAAFVNVGQQDFEFPINKAVVPNAPNRKSRNQLRDLAASDPKLLAKLGKKITKKALGPTKVQKEARPKPLVKPVQTKTGVKYQAASSSDESSSESDSSDSDSDDGTIEPSPLPAKRSDEDPKEAVRYDAIKALWRPKKRIVSSVSIKTGMKDFWELMKTIRDRWKIDAAAVKAAEEKGAKGELPLLKSRVRDQRNMIEVAFTAAVEHGHRSILELSSENIPLIYLCYQFLHDRILQDDVNGPLSRSILKLVAMCVTLTEEKLTKTFMAKTLPKAAKKADPEIQALIKKIEAAAKEGSKRLNADEKASKPAPATKPASPSVQSPPAKLSSTASSGTKRAAPQGSLNGQPAKRVANAGTNSTDIKTGAAKPATTVTKKSVGAGGATKPAGSAASTTVKSKTAVSKPSSFFNVMQNSTKKPTPAAKPASASVVATALKNVEKKVVPTPTVAESAARSGFSFADTMANLTKPKEKEPSPKAETEAPPETEEQKKRRLRKESRRSLRVSFKPDSMLEEVRYFTHDPDEELGHDASMTRDVGDVGGEGRMFKQHKDMMELDEEDDGPGEEDLKPFKEPSIINFDDVDEEERNRNFAPYGGGSSKPDSPERTAREQYEANTLMVFYTDPQDIPPNPKEPSEDVEMADEGAMKSFGVPQEVTMKRASKLSVTVGSTQSTQPATNTPDLASILAAINPQMQPAPAQNAPQGNGQTPELQAILAQFSQPQSQAQPFQAPQPNPPQLDMSQNLASLLAGLQPQQQPQQPAPPLNTNQPAPDLAAFFAALQQNSGGAVPPPPNPAAFPPGFPNMPFPFPPQMQQSQQQQQANGYPFENEERRRWREGGGEQRQQDANRNQGGKKKGVWVDKKFTQPCKYYSLGRCQKGDKCTYLHA